MSDQALQYKSKGNAAFQSGDYDLAISHFSEAIKLDPNNAVFYSNRSMCHATKGDFESALTDGNKCVELKPSWPKNSKHHQAEPKTSFGYPIP